MEIEIPNNWRPRPYQRPLWDYLETGGKRAIAVWHRRAGKDDVAMHWTAVAAHQRVANYWHLLPEASQARKAIWTAINPHTGRRRIDEAFPLALRETTLENEMMIRLRIGSTYQVAGSDNYDSLVGSAPGGVIFSEWALADPGAWGFIRPMLLENNGWAIFPYTPRGRNHGATFFDVHRKDADWFVERLTADETSVFTPDQLANERAELIKEYGQEDGDNRFRQEYLCSFEAGLPGAYYGHAMERAEKDGRICAVPWIAELPVHTGWDLGRRDLTTIWFFQLPGGVHGPVHFIDYIENNGVDITWYAKELDKRPYKYGKHALPHDAESEHLEAPKTIAGALRNLGYRDQIINPRTDNIDQDINVGRMLLPRCKFDETKCERGINALRNYRKAWDDVRKVYHDRPLHDWSSHGADGFRAAAMGLAGGLDNTVGAKKLTYPRLAVV